MSDSTDRIIRQIDAALGRYYALRNAPYYDNDKLGKFVTYCSENGLDDDATVEEEFEQGDPAESLLVDFDDDFPGIDANDERRNLKIFQILKNCRENETAYMDRNEKYSAFTVTRKDWIISERDLSNTLDVYLKQCPALFDDKFQEDKSILKLLTVGLRIDEPYLSYLADTFQRERIEHLEKKEHFTLPLWQHTNRHLKELKDIDYTAHIMDNTAYEACVNAIRSYFHRVSPQVMFFPPTYIVESLRDISEYIAGTVAFVAGLAANKTVTCPFQFDAVFAFNHIRKSPHQAHPGAMEEDSDDDDDDDDDSDEEDKKFEYYDCFGPIKQRLKSEKLLYTVQEVEEEKGGAGTTTKQRLFRIQFDELKESKIKEKYGTGTVFKEYPRKHRFCAVIDRRKPNDGDNKGKDIKENDEIIMFEPPDDCNSFPDNKVDALFYFNTSRTCIIPEFGYSKNKENGGDSGKPVKGMKNKLLSRTITCLSQLKGGIMLLTFHVESVDEIRCYAFLNGQHFRFDPEDIVKFLPSFFDPEYSDNEAFVISERARTLIKEMKKNLRDVKFKAFLNKNRSTDRDIKESKNRYNKFILM